MSHECEECGQTFETLSRLRLHDCADGGEDTQRWEDNGDRDGVDGGTRSDDGSESSVAAIDDPLTRVSAGDIEAVHEAVAAFEAALASAQKEGGETYRDVFWPYYEQMSNALDAATRSDGWELLADVLAAYDPTLDKEVPRVTPAVANAVGRYLIRTRLTDGVAAIEPAALEYLDAVAVHADEYADVAREETHAYGWGIDHPDHDIVTHLRERIETDVFSVNPALEHAFYADQHAAVEALETLATETADQGSLQHHREGTVTYGRFLLDAVYGIATDGYWPTTPRFYDWHEEFEITAELDEAVETRVRDLVVDLGFEEQLPRDWNLQDLAF